MHPDVSWSYRPIFSYLAAENPGAAFSLVAERQRVVHADLSPECVDADDAPNIEMPSREEIEAEFLPGGKVASMYEGFEARAEQVEMAQEVRDAFALRGHRVIEAGTGVGKSIAYLLPAAEAAKRNHITVGIATKSNNLPISSCSTSFPG